MSRYRLSGIRTRAPKLPDVPLVARLLKVSPVSLSGLTLVRRSLDARRKPDLFYECAVEFERDAAPETHLNPPLSLEEVPPPRGPEPLLPRFGRKGSIVVVGTGPAGLFAALALAEAGAEPVVLERGDPAEDRYRKVMRFWTKGDFDPESNVQFGEGGAGTFSDGKLTCGKRHDKVAVVLTTLHRFGGPDTILYDARPHIGTDRLVVVLRTVRRHLLERGATLRYRAKVVDVVRKAADGPLAALRLESGEEIPCEAAILALGHSARDTVEVLRRSGVALSAKPFAMGVRIEHPQEKIDLLQYGRLAASCGVFPADYRQAHLASSGRGVYTFCMCPGGEVIACSSEAGGVVTNGMSRYKRASGFANSGLVVQTREADFAGEEGPDVLKGQAFQRRVERAAFDLAGRTYAAPALRVTDFLRSRETRIEPRALPRTTYAPAVVPRLFDALYPPAYLDALAEGLRAFDARMKGFVSEEALLIAPESRTSSPVRIDRDDSCQSSLPGLFPAGEGAGFAGGIVSAALDGLRVARAVRAKLTGEPFTAERAAPVGAPEY